MFSSRKWENIRGHSEKGLWNNVLDLEKLCLHLSSSTSDVCDHGQVTQPLWAFVSSSVTWKQHNGSVSLQQITPDLLVIYQQITSPLKTTALFCSLFCGSGILRRAQPGGSVLDFQFNVNRGCSHLKDVQDGALTWLSVNAGHFLGAWLDCQLGYLPVTPQHGSWLVSDFS